MERERKRPSDPHPRVAIPAMALFAFVLASAFLLVGSGDCDSDAASYGSGAEPYGGLYADWSELTDGADYYVVAGGEVLITFEGRSMNGIAFAGGTDFAVSPEDSSIYGNLHSNSTITLDGKTVNLVSTTIYGSDLPIYGKVNYGTIEDPVSSVDAQLSNLAYQTFFVKPGSQVNFESTSMLSVEITALSVTEGFGLSITDDGSISGKLNKAGVVTAKIQYNNKSTKVVTEKTGTLICTDGGKFASSISIRSEDSVKMGSTITVHADVTPSDAAFKEVSWTISSQGHGGYYVDGNGDLVIIGVSEGDIEITAKSKDGSNVSASKTISVSDADINVKTIELKDHINGNESLSLDSDVNLLILKGRFITGNPNIETYLVNMPDGVGTIAGKTTDHNYVLIPKAGETELQWVDSYGAYGTDSGTLTLVRESTITFDANGGSVDGQSTKTETTTGTIRLPAAIKDGSTFSGWYDAKENGNFIGSAGAEYTPSEDITLYAHWDVPSLVLDPEYTWRAAVNGLTINYTPYVRDSITLENITDFKVEIVKDPTECLRGIGNNINGTLKDLIPATYTVQIKVTKNGYNSATQDFIIEMSTVVLEPIDAKAIIGEKWTVYLALRPNDAYIVSYTVKFNNETAKPNQYDAGKSGNKGFYIVCKEEGIYTIDLVVDSTITSSAIKTITLRAEPPREYKEKPTISSIKATRYAGASDDNPAEPNTYYFSAFGVANYDTLIWDFGDGETEPTTNVEVVHTFKVIGAYTVKCTAKNNVGTAEAFVILETLDEPSVDASDIINIGSMYQSKAIKSSYSNLTLKATCDGRTLDCFKLNKSTLTDGKTYIYVVTGTCNEIGLVGKEVTFLLSNGSTPVETWKATVYAQSDPDDVKIEASAKYKANGLVVTLTDIAPNKSSMRLMVDWGDGSNLSRDAASAEFTHEYSSKGKYSVSMVWTWTSSDGTPSQREFTVNVDLSSSEGPSIVYHANGGQGTMDAQTGSKKYTIQECKFVREGMTCKYWNTSPDLKGTTYKAGDEVSPEGKLDLYAVWVPEESEDSNDVIRYAACALLIGIAALILIRRYVL